VNIRWVTIIHAYGVRTTDRDVIAALVQKCLDARGVGCEEWEAEIDERVAALYGL
jgi:hypothetical protein